MHLHELDTADSRLIEAAIAEHGALLLQCPDDFHHEAFEALTRELCAEFHHVGTRIERKLGEGDGYTTTVFPDNFRLLAHSEGAYRPHMLRPGLCFFLCLVPPEAPGGETTLVDGVEMAIFIPDELRNRLKDQGIIYECRWEKERWQVEFLVDTVAELEAILSDLPTVEYNLAAGETLTLFYRASAIHQQQGQDCFCNGLLTHLPEISHPAYQGTPVYFKSDNRMWFGDGSFMESRDINLLIDAHDEALYRHRWQKNELLIFDNKRVMHGREMTTTPCPRVIISRFGW